MCRVIVVPRILGALKVKAEQGADREYASGCHDTGIRVRGLVVNLQ